MYHILRIQDELCGLSQPENELFWYMLMILPIMFRSQCNALCFFRSPDQENPTYTKFNRDIEDFVHNIVRDQAGNVVGTVVREVADSGDDEQTDEDAGIFEDIPLAVPVMDVVEPVVGVPSPLPSVLNELQRAFRLLDNNR